jgi:hypothetical protein
MQLMSGQTKKTPVKVKLIRAADSAPRFLQAKDRRTVSVFDEETENTEYEAGRKVTFDRAALRLTETELLLVLLITTVAAATVLCSAYFVLQMVASGG